MKDERWAAIVHNILILKHFTLLHLRHVVCDRGNDCKLVLKELKEQGYIARRDGEFHLTKNIDMRFALLDKERSIVNKKGST